ncbi:ABC transporter permease [Vibrio sp. CB1-14]|uniref:FtsX-like permease family protein n=1 Tax=Vibrio chaetopteri TaxID=3016528 RepID=A0AAU8BKY6_9VIBR
MTRVKLWHLVLALRVYARHYLQAPLQAASILIGIVLAVMLFVAVQAINLNAKRSYADAAEQLSLPASQFIIPPTGQKYFSNDLYFQLRQAGLSQSLAVLEGRVRSSEGRRYSVQGSDVVAAVTATMNRGREDGKQPIFLFDQQLPLTDMLQGEPIALVSEQQFEQMGRPSQLILDDTKTQIYAVPDQWQLGNRMLVDISFAERLLNRSGQLSYIAVFGSRSAQEKQWKSLVAAQGQWIENTQSSDLDSLTDSFHLNLTAMSMLAFLVGLFIAYNGVKYSLLKRRRLLVQLQQAGLQSTIVFTALLVELTIMVLLGSLLGFIFGMQLSHWLHPTVALTLEQLYGATLLPGSWQWSWLFQALSITLTAALVACWQHFRGSVQQPLSIHSGYYALPEPQKTTQLLVMAIGLTMLAVVGLVLSHHFRVTMLWLGVLVVATPLYLPKGLLLLSAWAEKLFTSGLKHYLVAELKELVAPLSLAMMALLLAMTANLAMNTLVVSFEHTLKQWLEQRLHADIYISPAQSEMSSIQSTLQSMPGVSAIFTQSYLDTTVSNLPTKLGTKNTLTLEQTMVVKEMVDDFWPRFYQMELAAISEPMAVKLGLALGDELEVAELNTALEKPLKVGAIFYDYGSPTGELLIAPELWQRAEFSPVPTSLGIESELDSDDMRRRLMDEFGFSDNQLYDQQQIKTIALEIFSQTFAVTKALNGVTLMVAVIGLFSACFMLIEARKAAIARLYALGVRSRVLLGMVVMQMVVLVCFTLCLALPLGALVGYVLTDMVTLRAFGWSLQFVWSWSDIAMLSLVSIVTASAATALPLWRLVKRPAMSSLQSEVL